MGKNNCFHFEFVLENVELLKISKLVENDAFSSFATWHLMVLVVMNRDIIG